MLLRLINQVFMLVERVNGVIALQSALYLSRKSPTSQRNKYLLVHYLMGGKEVVSRMEFVVDLDWKIQTKMHLFLIKVAEVFLKMNVGKKMVSLDISNHCFNGQSKSPIIVIDGGYCYPKISLIESSFVCCPDVVNVEVNIDALKQGFGNPEDELSQVASLPEDIQNTINER